MKKLILFDPYTIMGKHTFASSGRAQIMLILHVTINIYIAFTWHDALTKLVSG